MSIFAAVFFLGAGIFFIVRRHDVTWMQKAAIGARLPSGCAVAEGVLLILMAVAIALFARLGWF